MEKRVVSGNQKARLKQLDVLRAIAIFLVMGRHQFAGHVWYTVGWAGVDLFFVLSGFLISTLLFNEYQKKGKIDFKSFLIRRGLRIYPSFYILIFVTIIFNLIAGKNFTWASVLAEMFFLQNYVADLWNHTWYLAVDQHFYVILLPLTLTLLIRRSKNKSDPFKPIIKIFIIVAIFTVILRIFYAIFIPYKTHYLHPTHLRLDSLTFGVFIGYLSTFHAEKFANFLRKRMNLILFASILLLSPCLIFDLEQSQFMHTVGITFTYLGFGGLILFLTYSEIQLPTQINQLVSPMVAVLAFIGLNSYSIYIWHMAVARWLLGLIEEIYPGNIHSIVEFWIFFFGSIALGILMSHILEKPVMKLRDRLFLRSS